MRELQFLSFCSLYVLRLRFEFYGSTLLAHGFCFEREGGRAECEGGRFEPEDENRCTYELKIYTLCLSVFILIFDILT